jgi:hypothetical protein
MKIKWNVAAVTVGASILGFLLQPNGPLGKLLWPLEAGSVQPEGHALGLLMLMGVLESLAFGVGISFLVFGWNWVKRITVGRANATAVYLSIAWVLVNWVPHVSLHMHQGFPAQPSDFWGIIYIDYGFHLTMIIAGCVLALFFLKMAPVLASASAPTPAAKPSTRPKTTT